MLYSCLRASHTYCDLSITTTAPLLSVGLIIMLVFSLRFLIALLSASVILCLSELGVLGRSAIVLWSCFIRS